LNCNNEDEIKTYFSKLSAGGKISHPLKDEFWGSTFGMFTDKFGKVWMLNYEKKQSSK
jgi:PhnB protein